jgi:putative DNA primase/helicase
MTLKLAPPPDDDDFGPMPPDDPPEGTTGKFTDLWAAEALYCQHGEDLRFVGGWKRWVAWDGRRWQLDTEALALHYAAETARVLATLAIESSDRIKKKMLVDGVTEDLKDKLEWADKELKAAIGYQSSRKLAAMLTCATHLREFATHHERFDADPMLLNCKNGIVRLDDGRFFPHLRSDLITMLAPVEYDPRAQCPTWDAFLERMQPDIHMRLYLQRLMGYSITGLASEHMMAFHYGTGANGKGTFLNTISAVVGEYARRAHPRLIFRSPNGDRHLTERASLFRARLVTCSEASEAMSFDESTMKDLVSTDRVVARRMREDQWEFDPTHTLHVWGNEKPIVRATDNGFWRRMQLIPWLVQLEVHEWIRGFESRLVQEEGPGILRWLVDGALEWHRIGLEPPETVRLATQEYRRASDTGGLFLTACVRDPEFITTKKAFRAAYETWCAEQGYEPLGARRMAEVLRRHGIQETTARTGSTVAHAWRGIRLLTE